MPESEPDRPRGQKHVDTLNALTGHIDAVAPAGAAIVVDGTRPLGVTPLADTIDVPPGHHDVEGHLGTLVKTVGLEAPAGHTVVADLRRARIPQGSTAPQADAGAPAAPVVPVSPDTAQAGGTFFTPRVITAGSLAVAALASLGTGLAFGAASSNNASTVAGFVGQYPSDYCAHNGASSVCSQWKSARDAQNTDTTLSYVFYAGAGVLAAASAATFLLWPREPKTASMWMVPTASPTGLGLGAGGCF